jgi:hypothetical protein
MIAARIGVAATLSVAATLAWAGFGRGEFWPRWVYFGLGVAFAAEFLLRRVLRSRPAGAAGSPSTARCASCWW